MSDTFNDEPMDFLLGPGDLDPNLFLQSAIDPSQLKSNAHFLWWRWADFHLYIDTPDIERVVPPLVITPESIDDSDQLEFVYTIFDHGNQMSTSKGEEMFTAGLSMCKLYYTIEKMIYLLVERLKSGGTSTDEEVRVSFGGHLLPQCKAFEVIINLDYNVVVTNFEPGAWGDRYLATIKRLAEKGYPYPDSSPRDVYRINRDTTKTSRTMR